MTPVLHTLPDLTRLREQHQDTAAFLDYARLVVARRGRLEDLPDSPAHRRIKAAVGDRR